MRTLLVLLLIAAFPVGPAFAQAPPKYTPEQQEKLKERDALKREAAALNNMAKGKEAIALTEKRLNLEREILGETHADVLDTLNWLARLQDHYGDFTAAKKSWSELASLRVKVYGKGHWKVIDAEVAAKNSVLLGALSPEQRSRLDEAKKATIEAITLEQKGKYAEAIPLAERAVRIRKEFLGEKHPEYAQSLTRLAWLYQSVARYKEAEPRFVEALEIMKEALGNKHPHYAINLSELAGLYTVRLRYSEAVPRYLESLQITKEAFGEKSLEHVGGLNNLAELYVSQGRYAEAEPLYLDALKIFGTELGEEHFKYATVLNNLATLYFSQGHYAKAEPYFDRALKIKKAALGDMHPSYATGLNNMGLLHYSIGQYAKAKPLYIEARDIRKVVLGPNHPDYASSLNNLGLLYSTEGRFSDVKPLEKTELLDAAKSAYDEALGILEGTYGKGHPFYASSLNNLAGVYESLGRYAEAESKYDSALGIFRGALGDNHPECASALTNLALLYKLQRQYEKAEPRYLEAMGIFKDALGKEHPLYARSLNNLGAFYVSKDQPTKAEPLYSEAVSIIQGHLERTAAIQSEAEQLRYLAISRSYLNGYLGLNRAHDAAVYSAVFRWHGAVTARQTFARAARSSSPETQASIESLRDVTRQINQLAQNPPQGLSKADQAKAVKELDGQRESIEKQIASQSQDFAEYQKHLKLTPAALQKQLPEGTALIDFLAHGDSISAFVVTKTSIARVVIEAGKPLEEKIKAFSSKFNLERTRPATGDDEPSVNLRKHIWEPLEKHLNGVTRVLICPDGPLCGSRTPDGEAAPLEKKEDRGLPFAALPGSDPKKYLLEELSIVIVPVPQLLPGLLAAEAKKFAGAPTLFAVGDVDFNGDPAFGEKPKPLPVAVKREKTGLGWLPLPNSKGEIEAISTLFAKQPQATVTKLVRGAATEAAVEREMPKHRFIHLATHGFFDPPKLVQQFQEGVRAGEKVLFPSVPPGLSNGIVCAGANKPTFHASGILTATQIAELDLRRVELVVLSACQTGLGDISGGEGVLGLQRAFQMAGARSTISTLWEVDDRATAELMKRLYSNRLEKSLSTAEALREAQLWVLNNGDKVGVFDEPQRANKRTPPNFWAAFTFAGDWR